MKKTILAIAAVVTLTVGNAFAQRHSRDIPAVHTSRVDNAYEEFKINKLDQIVKLSRKQENQIKKIENKYDRLVGNRRYSGYQGKQRLETLKEREIISVLTPVQRQRWFAYQSRFGSPYRKG